MSGTLPDVLLPFAWSGKARFWHYTTLLSLPAASEISINFGPPSASSVWLIYQGTSGRPRTAVGDLYTGVGAYMRHWLPSPKEGYLDGVYIHNDYLLESVYMPVYPLAIPILHATPMRILLVNTESFSLSWDLSFWMVESDETTFWTELMPYLRGILASFQKQDPERGL